MPLPVITDVFRCSIIAHAPSVPDPVVNVIHIRAPGATPGDVSDSVQARWPTFCRNKLQATFTWDQLTVTKLDGSAGVDFPWTGDLQSGTGAMIGLNSAMCVSWRTIVAGRSGRGRSFLAPMMIAQVDGAAPDLLEASVPTSLDTAGNAMLAGFIADGFEFVVASYVHATAEGVINTKTNKRICTMRKRVNGR